MYLATVLADTLNPSLANSAWILRCPHDGFSAATRHLAQGGRQLAPTSHPPALPRNARQRLARADLGAIRWRVMAAATSSAITTAANDNSETTTTSATYSAQ
jgi:hypothetical protein